MTRKMMTALGVLFFASLALGQNRDLKVGPAPGETAPVAPAWLYVIGINDYKFVPKLDTAVADAKAVRDLLLQKYQFSPDRLIERYDAQATRKQILGDLLGLARKLGKDDSLLIYYAGHGLLQEDLAQGFWVPVDGEREDPSTWISNADLRTYLAAIPARHIWLVSDSCFSGTLLAERSLPKSIDDKYYREIYKRPSRKVLTSGGNEPVADATGARDCKGHSAFACYFLKFLLNNSKPYLAPSEVYTEVSHIVAINSNQTPVFGDLKQAGHEGGEFVLIARAGGLPQDTGPAAPPTPAYTGTDTTSLDELDKRARERDEAEKKRQQQLEADRKKYFSDLEAFYQKALALDAKPGLTPAEKVALWQDFLVKFPENHSAFGPNPRGQYARDRIAFWQKQAPKPGRLESAAAGAPSGMVKIPAGCFQMGCAPGDSQCQDDEKPRHEVCLDAFSMDATEVTNQEYSQCVSAGKCAKAHYSDGSCYVYDGSNWKQRANTNPEFEKADHPVACVDWDQARSYCSWAGQRLPTEAEWEYAARAGTNTIYYWGDRFDGSYAWGGDNSAKQTYPAGTRKPNPWGLYDVTGNVWEWAADWYDSGYYGKSPKNNPTGPTNGTYRVVRGGSWLNNPFYLRVSDRDRGGPTPRYDYGGFRCAGD